MTYEPPSGWVEELGAEEEPEKGSGRLRFHTTDRCRRIRDGARLMAVAKPYTATRCPGCARAEASPGPQRGALLVAAGAGLHVVRLARHRLVALTVPAGLVRSVQRRRPALVAGDRRDGLLLGGLLLR